PMPNSKRSIPAMDSQRDWCGSRKEKSGYLLLSDMPANVIYKLSTDGKEKSLYLDHSGYTGLDIWRVGFMQTKDRSKDDPLYEEFAMIRVERACARPRGSPGDRHLGGPRHRPDREERQAGHADR